MPGSIIGILGKQRSGKTLYSYLLCRHYQKEYKERTGEDLRVYTNIWTRNDGFRFINSISEIPLDLDPKIVFIDEIYNGCDAQDYKKLNDISIFINTLGKQNCLFIFTSIEANMVYNRIRNQMQVCILVKGYPDFILYKVLNMDKNASRVFQIRKTPELFRDIHYDSDFIPLEFNWKMDEWEKKLIEFYRINYGLCLKVSR